MEPTQLPPVNTQQSQEPSAPEYVAPTPNAATEAPQTKQRRWWVLPVVLMVLPGLLLIGSILAYAIANFIFDSAAPSTPIQAESGDSAASLFGEATQANPVKTILNVILFFVGAVTVALGPLSFIGGLVLLIVRLSKK